MCFGSDKNVSFWSRGNIHVHGHRPREGPGGRADPAETLGSRPRRPDPPSQRRDPQADVAARREPGPRQPGQPQVGVPSRPRDPRALSRHRPQRHRAAARRWPTALSARLHRHPRAARRRAARRHAGPAGLRERPPARRPARQSGAGPGPAWRAAEPGAAPCQRPARYGSRTRLRRGRPDLYLRPGAAVAAVPGCPRGRAGVPKRSQLRPDDEVLWRRGIDAGAGPQDADARRGRPAAPGERERAPARRAARTLRLLAHPRHERRDAPGLRTGRASRAHQYDGPHPRRVGDRQGAHRAGDSLQLAAGAEGVRQGELRRAAGDAHRVGALRLREGRVHRRRAAQEGTLRARRRRDAPPRRDRRHQSRDAGQAAARAAGARVRAAGRNRCR